MYISILLPRGVSITPGAVRVLLGCAVRRSSGGERWGGAVCDVFPGRRGTLILARPAVSVRIADYAVPILNKYFTD